ncbi:MAG: type IV toxin-antitoxin system AbiEi family antitoxin domain-containing protein [Planctomycetes bacterium]|nr:type IV toxin-antitoxin system AbiEi family antitoxin domain-containing protein [Planctomycetota bacterium]
MPSQVQTAPSLVAAKAIFKQRGGVLRTSQALRSGIHPATLYALREQGEVVALSRGLYRLAQLPPLDHPDLVTVALRVPKGVFCLISALAFHELTTQIPHEVYLAIARNAQPPRLDHPPTRVFRFSQAAFGAGIERHRMSGTWVHIYSAEKTLADCFKYRNKIGMEAVLEALRTYKERGKPKVNELLRYAQACRVERVMRPYLEAIL